MTEREKAQGFTLKDKSVCIVGCGGLGCNVGVHLVCSGIGKLYICDFDTVNESNLNRQFLYTENDIGKSKCISAKNRLSLLSEGTEIFCTERKITHPDDMSFAKDCDIIILAVDNCEARKCIYEYAKANCTPVVFGGIDDFYGTAYLYVPGLSPCPECAGMFSDKKAETNISSTAGIIGSAQAALAIKFLLSNDATVSGKLLIYDSDRFDTLCIKPSANCSVCKRFKL